MRIAVAHDYLTQRGGAERVVLAWARHLRPMSISTLVWDSEAVLPPAGIPVLTTPLQRSGAVRREPRIALPLLPRFARRLPVPPEADVVLVSSSGLAHALSAAQPKVVYWHTPARWLHAPDDYLLGLPAPVRAGLRLLRPHLMRADRVGLSSVAEHLCNSRHVKERLQQAYGIEATVVHPPVDPLPGDARPPACVIPDRFFLTVARRRGYKNTDLVIEAARQAGVALVTVGGYRGETPAGSSHTVLEHVTDGELKWLYQKADALVSASREDFGLTPLEANLEGTPALVAGAGGFLESVVAGVNGAFFAPESVEACAQAMRDFDPAAFSAVRCRAHATTGFSADRHVSQVRAALERALDARPREVPLGWPAAS